MPGRDREEVRKIAEADVLHASPFSEGANWTLTGDAEERLDAVDRAAPDCEALLHSSSTLSWIVARGKRA